MRGRVTTHHNQNTLKGETQACNLKEGNAAVEMANLVYAPKTTIVGGEKYVRTPPRPLNNSMCTYLPHPVVIPFLA